MTRIGIQLNTFCHYFGEKMDTRKHNLIGNLSATDATFSQVWDVYMQNHVEVRVSAKRRMQFIAANLLKMFGDSKLSAMRPNDFQTYLRRRQHGHIGRPATESTVRRELNAMVAAMNFCAHKQRCIPPSIVPYVPLPKASPPKDVWLKKEELQDFVRRIQGLHSAKERLSRIFRFVMIASQTAARRSAIAELKWDQVDLDNGLIHFNPHGRVQTIKRRPVVPISKSLWKVLKRAYEERQTDYVLDHPGDVAKMFERAAEAVGYPHVTPHVLRHTWATHAAIDGVDTWKIAGILGDNEATVRRNYMHYNPHYLRDAVNR